MLSIIICSKSPDLRKHIATNIAETVGVPYELLVIDNADGKYGICEAYNQAAARSQYPNLCFTHEDVRFHTLDWGQKVCQWLSDKETGVIGIAGSVVKTKVPSPFWEWQIDDKIFRRNIVQQYENGTARQEYTNPKQLSRTEVITVDGVWFCCRREVWEQVRFDEQTFREFHFYDLDFSLGVRKTHRVYVVYDILLEHFSVGSINLSFIKSALLFSKKWYSQLPQYTNELSEDEVDIIQHRSYARLIKHLATHHYVFSTNIALLWFVFRSNGFFKRSSYKLIRSFYKLRSEDRSYKA